MVDDAAPIYACIAIYNIRVQRSTTHDEMMKKIYVSGIKTKKYRWRVIILYQNITQRLKPSCGVPGFIYYVNIRYMWHPIPICHS